jgi:hypothetical protein
VQTVFFRSRLTNNYQTLPTNRVWINSEIFGIELFTKALILTNSQFLPNSLFLHQTLSFIQSSTISQKNTLSLYLSLSLSLSLHLSLSLSFSIFTHTPALTQNAQALHFPFLFLLFREWYQSAIYIYT